MYDTFDNNYQGILEYAFCFYERDSTRDNFSVFFRQVYILEGRGGRLGNFNYTKSNDWHRLSFKDHVSGGPQRTTTAMGHSSILFGYRVGGVLVLRDDTETITRLSAEPAFHLTTSAQKTSKRAKNGSEV